MARVCHCCEIEWKSTDLREILSDKSFQTGKCLQIAGYMHSHLRYMVVPKHKPDKQVVNLLKGNYDICRLHSI